MSTVSARRFWSVTMLVAALVATAGFAGADDKACTAWGKELFVNHCAPCHGMGGGGNGPAANALKTAPADLTLIAKTHEGHFPREWVEGFIEGTKALRSHGKREMPVWGPIFASQSVFGEAGAKAAIEALADYIETLQKK